MSQVGGAAVVVRATEKPRHAIWAQRGFWLLLATGVGFLLWLAYILANPIAFDAHAYFLADPLHPYGGAEGAYDAYVYSPAFSQAIEPLRWLGWDGFRIVWRGAELLVLTAFTGPFLGPLLFVRLAAIEVNIGNIHLLLAAAVVAGFRWPALWSFVLLTKVTPGVGLLWFAVRREWRHLAIALGVTAAIVAVSFAWSPSSWFEWFASLRGQTTPDKEYFLTAPLVLRLAAAAVLVYWGARHDQRWTVLVAAWMALPVTWEFSIVMLTGLVPLLRSNDPADDLNRHVEGAGGAGLGPVHLEVELGADRGRQAGTAVAAPDI